MRRAARDNAGAPGDDVAQAAATITIVGRRQIGEGEQALATRAHALADAAGVDLLAIQFDGSGSGANFVGASSRLDLADQRIASAVMDFMREAAVPAAISRRSDDIALGRHAG